MTVTEVSVQYVRFDKRWFKKTVCSVCWCVVKRCDMGQHAKYHVARGEGQSERSGSVSFKMVEVHPDGHVPVDGIWYTNSENPGPL